MLKDTFIESPATFLCVSVLKLKFYIVTLDQGKGKPILINQVPPELAETAGMPIGKMKLSIWYN